MTDFIGRKRLSWEETAVRLAFDIAKYRSQDPYVQVGAVIIKNDNSIVLGYNGSPRGVEIDWSDRDARRDKVIHAEENALGNVKFGEVRLLAVTGMPCKVCIKTIANKGVKKVYYGYELEGYENEATKERAKEFKVELIHFPILPPKVKFCSCATALNEHKGFRYCPHCGELRHGFTYGH
jgi:deoxycytidylate deaminase